MPRIVIVHPEAVSAERWRIDLGRLLPDHVVETWSLGSPPADYAVAWNPPADFFDQQPALKVLFSAGAGVDALLQHPRLPAGLPIARIEDAGMGDQMVEYCLHEILRIQRRFDDYQALQQAGEWRELPVARRSELPVGVFGLGVLGLQVARALAAFGYPVSGYSRSPAAHESIRCFSGDGLREFLGGCQVLVLLAPLTAQTRGFFNAERLSWLPRGASLINVARGPLVVDDDLIAALDTGHLAGATLDVFAREPLPADHPFWRHPRVRMTPHVSALTLADLSARQVASRIRALERGEPPGGLVDREQGY
jgi:glyoxylate/hydroxypyruvate reductase